MANINFRPGEAVTSITSSPPTSPGLSSSPDLCSEHRPAPASTSCNCQHRHPGDLGRSARMGRIKLSQTLFHTKVLLDKIKSNDEILVMAVYSVFIEWNIKNCCLTVGSSLTVARHPGSGPTSWLTNQGLSWQRDKIKCHGGPRTLAAKHQDWQKCYNFTNNKGF